MARLNTTVHVYDGHEVTVYLPGQEVDPRHLAQITAPGVWETSPEDPTEEAPHASGQKPREPTEAAGIPVPPRAGRGSGLDVWREYAIAATAEAGLKIDIPEDAKRDDIIGALSDAGIRVE